MHLFWSFSAITTGTYPSTDYLGHAIEVGHHGMEHAGEAVATSPAGANWSGIVLYCKGDLDWWVNDVKMPHWSSPKCCGFCYADRGERNYKHFAQHAAWRGTTMDQREFNHRFSAAGTHVILDHMCKVSRSFWALDTLHVLDYNGVTCHAIANVLLGIIKDNEFGLPRQADTLERLLGLDKKTFRDTPQDKRFKHTVVVGALVIPQRIIIQHIHEVRQPYWHEFGLDLVSGI